MAYDATEAAKTALDTKTIKVLSLESDLNREQKTLRTFQESLIKARNRNADPLLIDNYLDQIKRRQSAINRIEKELQIAKLGLTNEQKWYVGLKSQNEEILPALKPAVVPDYSAASDPDVPKNLSDDIIPDPSYIQDSAKVSVHTTVQPPPKPEIPYDQCFPDTPLDPDIIGFKQSVKDKTDIGQQKEEGFITPVGTMISTPELRIAIDNAGDNRIQSVLAKPTETHVAANVSNTAIIFGLLGFAYIVFIKG